MSLKKFVTTCTVTFKTFNFAIVMSKAKTNLWHFSASNPDGDKNYVVMCIPKLTNGKSLIKVALKKVPEQKKLVVICDKYSDSDLKEAQVGGYSLVTLKDINRYGEEMLEILERDSFSAA